MKKRFSDEQILVILSEAEQSSDTTRDACQWHNLTEQVFFRWRNKYSGMGVLEVRRLRSWLRIEEASNALIRPTRGQLENSCVNIYIDR